MRYLCLILLLTGCTPAPTPPPSAPYLVVLGIGQDAGVPQAGNRTHPAWADATLRRYTVSLGLVDPTTGQRWLFEATPDIKDQLHALDRLAPAEAVPGLDGVFLTHAHIGHYTGLMHFGHEVMGAKEVPVYAMPRMTDFLRTNGPWDQLVRYQNISLQPLQADSTVVLNENLNVTPFLVPHREEYSETVGYHIAGPNRSVLFIPDVNKWAAWDAQGTRIEEVLATVDVAYLDATFYNGDELPGRNMADIPHPFIVESMMRFAALPAAEQAKVRFIHLNHSNPALLPEREVQQQIKAAGFDLAVEGEVEVL